jgi:hypothetical protein
LAHAIALEAVTPSLSLGKAANAMLNSQFHCLPAKLSGASLTSCSRGRRIFRSASEIPSAAPLNAGVRPSQGNTLEACFGRSFHHQVQRPLAHARAGFQAQGASNFIGGLASLQAQR